MTFPFFKSKANPSFNMHHPDLAHKIEFAFQSGNKKYYQFTEEFEIPAGRYKWISAYLQEHDLRIAPNVLSDYCDQMDAAINQGKLSQVAIIVEKIRGRTKLAFNPDTIKRLASVIYFDETEDLSDMSLSYSAEKIKNWDKNDTVAFFLTRPIRELLGLNDTSETLLRNYLTSIRILEDLTSVKTEDTQDQSLENSSKNEI